MLCMTRVTHATRFVSKLLRCSSPYRSHDVSKQTRSSGCIAVVVQDDLDASFMSLSKFDICLLHVHAY